MFPALKVTASFTGLLAMLAAAPTFADGECRQWGVPETLAMTQGNQRITFKLEEEGTDFHGWAYYETSKGWVKGNVSGSVADNTFQARVLWTYSGVNAIGRYSGKIIPRIGVPAGEITYGFVNEGYTYDEYDTDNYAYWSATHFICQDAEPPPPAPVPTPPNPVERTRDHSAAAVLFEPKSIGASDVAESDQSIASATALAQAPTVIAIGRVRTDGATTTAAPSTPMSICGNASAAAARNSPAAPGLQQQCATRGGFLVLDPPLAAAFLDALAVKGGPIVDADPELAAMRAQQAGDAGMRGFNIGVAATGQDTLPGHGKQHIYNSLAREEKPGYDTAVSFVLERNRR